MITHQSMISSWNRCAEAVHLENAGHPSIQTSALSFGTLLHYCVEVFEREFRTGTDFAVARKTAIETFRHYWHPNHIQAVTTPVELWLPGQTYGSLARIGEEGLGWYADKYRTEDEELLATEFSFSVPIEGTWDYDEGQPHILNGTLDRLAAKNYKRNLVLEVGDIKSGKDYAHLRQNLQFSAYCYATTRREFWLGNNGEEGFGPERGEQLYRRFQKAYRRGTWISLRSKKAMDAGWRGPDDYRRFALAVDQIALSMKAEIYPLSLSGENCSYCPMRNVCAGVGVPTAQHGAPPV